MGRRRGLCATDEPVSSGLLHKKEVSDMDTAPPFPAPPGFAWVFCASFKHYRTGKQVFPKNGKCFAFLVRRK